MGMGEGGCEAGRIGMWEFIMLFCQLLWVLKILHNKSFNNKHMLLTIEIQVKICGPTLCLSNCQ